MSLVALLLLLASSCTSAAWFGRRSPGAKRTPPKEDRSPSQDELRHAALMRALGQTLFNHRDGGSDGSGSNATSLPGNLRVGDRVRRGPTWDWGDQDGGSGTGLGTVLGAGQRSAAGSDGPGWVEVRWDHAPFLPCNYRLYGGYRDLVPAPNNGPPTGRLLPRDRVRRGPTWRWGSQDGRPPALGTVVEVSLDEDMDEVVCIRWDHNGRTGAYRMYGGFQDIQLAGDGEAVRQAALPGGLRLRDRVRRGPTWNYGPESEATSGNGTIVSIKVCDDEEEVVAVHWDEDDVPGHRFSCRAFPEYTDVVRVDTADAPDLRQGVAAGVDTLRDMAEGMFGGLADRVTEHSGDGASTAWNWTAAGDAATRFSDVGMLDEVRLEMQELVDFLTDASRYHALGAKIPRGVLLEGPPGTGKTLLARALAGECGVAFAATTGPALSASRLAGVASQRIQTLFREARARAPCIVFVDELDSVGAHRRSDSGGGVLADKADALNSLLTELDGFSQLSADAPIIFVASTNRADALDPALLRPGRLDRRIAIGLPDARARETILGVCAHSRPLAASADLAAVAQRTTGMSGAELESLVNEAAICAARERADAISAAHLEAAYERARMGIAIASSPAPDERRHVVAVHESGHALMMLAIERWLNTAGCAHEASMLALRKVSLLPRLMRKSGGMIGGATMADVSEGFEWAASRRSLLGELCVAMGGRAAEELLFGEADAATIGATNDFAQAMGLAKRMVTELGMSGRGPLAFLGGESGAAGAEVEREAGRLVLVGYAAAKELAAANERFLRALVDELKTHETMDREMVDRVAESYALRRVDAVERADARDMEALRKSIPFRAAGSGKAMAV